MDRWSEKSIMQMYILENKIPIPVEDLILWGRWFENVENKRVAFTEFDNLRVSTVFLGIGRQLGIGKTPLLFETMVFDRDNLIDKYCMRYATWYEAEAGHYAVVALIKSSL